MQSPLYKNARIYIDGHFQTGGFEVTADGRFGTILPQDFSGEVVDLKGATVIPGLVDVHIHGAVGADFSDGDSAGLERMAAYLASAGVTSFAPASMTLPYETLEKAFATFATAAFGRLVGGRSSNSASKPVFVSRWIARRLT